MGKLPLAKIGLIIVATFAALTIYDFLFPKNFAKVPGTQKSPGG